MKIITLFNDIPEALENNYNFPYRFNFKPKNQSSFTYNINKEILH